MKAQIAAAIAVFASSLACASIELASPSPDWLALAAEDLAKDYERVTGQSWTVDRFWRSDPSDEQRVVIGSLENEVFAEWLGEKMPEGRAWLSGKREAFLAASAEKTAGALVIAGSDDRGAMRGIYAVSHDVLKIDPTYLWTGIEPALMDSVDWAAVDLRGDEPSFGFRGWFINDEDLLTGWIEGGGTRYIDYPHYATVVHENAMAMVCETAVRLDFNLIIPASFLDIDNPPERKLVNEARKRGLHVSMHHIEPLGVSAFTFFNYWRERGEEPLFSYYSEPEKLEETWRHYGQRWARFPDVVWQLGLRGIGDRPMWMADPGTPQSDADRGAIISDAIKLQKQIVIDVTRNPAPRMTTTLWAEGAALFGAGHLEIPKDVTIVFADNSAGRVWQDDFFNTEREPGRQYGVYFHHQLWGTGPHMVQGVSPLHQARLFRAAYEKETSDFAVSNVSSIREFALGIHATSQTLIDTPAFDADAFLQEQCGSWFGNAGGAAAAAYDVFFDSYLETDRGIPYFLDGLLRARGNKLITAINKVVETGELPERTETASSSWGATHLSDMHPQLPEPGLAVDMLETQRDDLAHARTLVEQAEAAIEQSCDASRLGFFRENLVSQWHILTGLTEWALALEKAMAALLDEDRDGAVTQAERALEAWSQIERGQSIITENPRWSTWYRGDTKMSLANVKAATAECVKRLSQPSPK